MSLPGDRPLVLGLRGTLGPHPPNALESLTAALAEGADGIVVDVDVTRDGIAVACDDRWLRAFGGETFSRVMQTDAAQLSGLGVLTIARVLERFAPHGIVGLWLGAIAGAAHRQARRRAVLAALRGASPWLFGGDPAELAQLGAALPSARCLLRGSAAEDTTALAGVHGFCRPVRVGPAPARVRRQDVLSIGTDCDTPSSLRHALDGEFDALVSERPGWVARRLAAVGRSTHRSTAS